MKNLSTLYCGLFVITMTHAQGTIICKNVQHASVSANVHLLKDNKLSNKKVKKEKLEKASLPTRTAEAVRYKSYAYMY